MSTPDRSGSMLVTAAVLIVVLVAGILVSVYFQTEVREFIDGLGRWLNG